MGGWCPSLVCVVCGMAVVCATAVGSVCAARPASRPSQCSTHKYCVVSCTVRCRVCAVVWVSVPLCCCVVGYPLSAHPPRRGWWWGYRGWWGGIVWRGGMVMEGRAAWHRPPRLCVGVPSYLCRRPPSAGRVGVLNGGCGVCCDALRSDWVRRLVLFPLLFCLVHDGGLLRYGTVFCPLFPLFLPSPLPALCVCCHSVVGLVVSL